LGASCFALLVAADQVRDVADVAGSHTPSPNVVFRLVVTAFKRRKEKEGRKEERKIEQEKEKDN
jgi:hypothetical protein